MLRTPCPVLWGVITVEEKKARYTPPLFFLSIPAREAEEAGRGRKGCRLVLMSILSYIY